VQNEIQELREQIDNFLGVESEVNIRKLQVMSRIQVLVAAGHIHVPFTLTEVAESLGTQDTSSLP